MATEIQPGDVLRDGKPSAPPVQGDIATYLRTGVTDPEREPAFAAYFDEAFADDPVGGPVQGVPARVRGGSVAGLGATRGRHCGRESSMKIYATQHTRAEYDGPNTADAQADART